MRFGKPLFSVGSWTEVKTRRSMPSICTSGSETVSRTVNSFANGLGEVGEKVGQPVSGAGGGAAAIAARTWARSTFPKSVTVPDEVPLAAVVQLAGASPTPHSSFHVKDPPVARGAVAR